jgi:23S rRNA pseudouridine1911/1915/1917 synthase
MQLSQAPLPSPDEILASQFGSTPCVLFAVKSPPAAVHCENLPVPFVTRQTTIASDSPFSGGRADRLVQQLVGGSRSHVTGLFDHECVTLNDRLLRDPGWRLSAGDQIAVRFEADRRYAPLPRPRVHRGFAVVYEDRCLIVVEKAAELLTVPTERGERHTLVERVGEYVRRATGGRGAFPVHRLDRGVSGLLVFGKTREIADTLRDQFAARKPMRCYLAIVVGWVEPGEGEFRSYLATDKALNRFSTEDPQIGQLAVTHYRVLDYLSDTTLVEVQLETGRRNQIRVHFAEAGHPVLGDPRYEAQIARHRFWPYKRIALHAKSLAFEHPVTGETLKFESHLAKEMAAFINQTGRSSASHRDPPPGKP